MSVRDVKQTMKSKKRSHFHTRSHNHTLLGSLHFMEYGMEYGQKQYLLLINCHFAPKKGTVVPMDHPGPQDSKAPVPGK